MQAIVLMRMRERSPYKHMGCRLSKGLFLSAGVGSLATALLYNIDEFLENISFSDGLTAVLII